MPVSEYYKGHGKEVMAGMRKKYGKRAKKVFYATDMEPKSKMPMGASMSPHGDIGYMRSMEARKVVPVKGAGPEYRSGFKGKLETWW